MQISPQTSVFFPEIDRVGVSALARYLSSMGAVVRGAVEEDTLLARRLRDEGIGVEISLNPDQIKGMDLVIKGGEVYAGHPHLLAAKERNIPVYTPAAAIARLIRDQRVIGVTGTHGKGSVASMIAWILEEDGQEPGYIIGGELRNFEKNGRIGRGDWLVVELSEDDPALDEVHCDYGVCTFLELEHLHHEREPARLISALAHFFEKNERLKEAFINLDCLGSRRLVESLELRPTGYSLGFPSEFRGEFERKNGPPFELRAFHRATPLGEFTLELPGEYQVINALGAAALTWRLGVDPQVIYDALKSYRGVKDRYATTSGGGVKIIKARMNYPRGIAKALAAAAPNEDGRTIVVLRPDELVNLEQFHKEYARALQGVDEVILSATPESAERDRARHSLRLLAGEVEAKGAQATFLTDQRALEELVPRRVTPGDRIIFFGDERLMEQADTIQAALAEREAKSPPAEGQPPLDGPLTEGDEG